MKNNFQSYPFFLLFLLLQFACVKPYEPPQIAGPNDYLVVEGTINCNPDGITTICLLCLVYGNGRQPNRF